MAGVLGYSCPIHIWVSASLNDLPITPQGAEEVRHVLFQFVFRLVHGTVTQSYPKSLRQSQMQSLGQSFSSLVNTWREENAPLLCFMTRSCLHFRLGPATAILQTGRGMSAVCEDASWKDAMREVLDVIVPLLC